MLYTLNKKNSKVKHKEAIPHSKSINPTPLKKPPFSQPCNSYIFLLIKIYQYH